MTVDSVGNEEMLLVGWTLFGTVYIYICISRWWFQSFFIFTPTLENDPI